jgi:hypothetical protein
MRLRSHPHFMNPAYVGREVALEALETFYQLAPDVPDASHVEWPEQTRSIFLNDVFGLGLVPARFIRALSIRLDLEWLTTLITRRFDAANLEYFLAPLYHVAKKDGFKLRFELRQHRIRLKEWEEAFRVLAPIHQAFQTAGADVNVSWTYSGHWSKGECTFSLNKFVQFPRSVWKSEVISILDAQFSDEEYNYEDNVDYDPRDLDTWYNDSLGRSHPYEFSCDSGLGWFLCTLESCKKEECVLVREAESFYCEHELAYF